MTYQDAITYLYASTPAFHLVGSAAYKPGLDNTRALLAHLGDPHTRLRAVHIAGTNGKGSTSHLIAAALQSAGFKVGLYTSPHLVDFRERIRVFADGRPTVERYLADGEPTADRRRKPSLSHHAQDTMIPQEAVIRFVQDNQSFLDQLRPSFFETAMAMAFWYFAEQQVDIAVVEVGLGGRLDSTNILPPFNPATRTGVLLSVITNIGMDHTEFLGNTLAQIANEKAGIIKPHTPCVIGETHPDTAPVFMAKADECGILGHGLETSDCYLYFADQCEYLRRCRIRDIRACELHGIYQEHNMQTAYVALRVLSQQLSTFDSRLSTFDFRLSTFDYQQGFAHVCTMTGLRGRWETLSTTPLTICDTGHNSHGIRYVAEQLKQLLADRCQLSAASDRLPMPRLRIVLGMVSDKDVEVVMSLLPTNAVYYFTQAQTQRAIPADKMLALARDNRLCGNSFSSVTAAIRAAQKDATESDIIFIGGSNYVVGEAIPLFD
ncbi:MAG: bifunctional folylpolyglutamate synthase/dihydrofolate synthase [Paludibacteraceae bacterium]|nr:bifunctional folylpolyglutamate synthase/dihydrofolate synthase [Paludibacteraceae bacterium]